MVHTGVMVTTCGPRYGYFRLEGSVYCIKRRWSLRTGDHGISSGIAQAEASGRSVQRAYDSRRMKPIGKAPRYPVLAAVAAQRAYDDGGMNP